MTNFIEAKEASKLLKKYHINLPESTIRVYASRGMIPTVKIGRYKFFDPEALADWAQNRKRKKYTYKDKK